MFLVYLLMIKKIIDKFYVMKIIFQHIEYRIFKIKYSLHLTIIVSLTFFFLKIIITLKYLKRLQFRDGGSIFFKLLNKWLIVQD